MYKLVNVSEILKYPVFEDLNGLPNPGEKSRFSRSICQREEKLCNYFKI